MSTTNELQGIWTQYGQERMAAWLAGGEALTILHAAVGSGNGSIPTVKPSQEALVSEEWRGLVNSVQQNTEDATDVIVDVALPNNVGGFWIREWGLFDDKGKLVAVGPHDEMHKPVITSGQAAEFLVKFHLPVSSSGVINLTIATQALATQGFVTSQVEAHNAAGNAHAGLFGTMDAHIIKTLEQSAHGFPMGAEGQILAVRNGKLVWIDPYDIRYEVGQYYFFQDEMPRPGMVPLHGLWVDDFSLYPQAVEYFASTWGQNRLVTLAEYNARHVAIWHTNADGSTAGWEGEGGANCFVLDNGRMLVADLAGMTMEQSCAALGVGGVQGDAVRDITGTVYVIAGHGFFNNYSGAFGAYGGSGTATIGETGGFRQGFDIKISRVVPTAAKNQTRAWGSNCCVYLGKQAS